MRFHVFMLLVGGLLPNLAIADDGAMLNRTQPLVPMASTVSDGASLTAPADRARQSQLCQCSQSSNAEVQETLSDRLRIMARHAEVPLSVSLSVSQAELLLGGGS